MKYDWLNYTSAYKEKVNSWLDEEAKRFTGCDGGFDTYYQYWANEPDTKLGENFWVKIIFANSERKAICLPHILLQECIGYDLLRNSFVVLNAMLK